VILSALLRRVRRTGLSILVCALLVGCTGLNNMVQSPTISPKDLYGGWVLETVGGKSPGAINIKLWRISFSTDQKWNYGGQMTERFGGMQLRAAAEIISHP
jgi:hypothetical protein